MCTDANINSFPFHFLSFLIINNVCYQGLGGRGVTPPSINRGNGVIFFLDQRLNETILQKICVLCAIAVTAFHIFKLFIILF